MPGLKRTDPQRLTETVAAWLQYEQMCYRTTLFSEAYMTYPIGQFLQSRAGGHVRAEYEHPILAPLKTGRGDKPRIDFVVLGEDRNKIEFAVETKWLNKSNDLVEQLIRDLVRVGLLVHKDQATGLIVLGGTLGGLAALFSKKSFAAHAKHKNSRPILPIEKHHEGVLWLDTGVQYRQKLFARTLKVFKGVEIPRAISITRLGPFPRDGRKNQVAVYGFRVVPHDHGIFLPSLATTSRSRRKTTRPTTMLTRSSKWRWSCAALLSVDFGSSSKPGPRDFATTGLPAGCHV
jgi:hypothetical protein